MGRELEVHPTQLQWGDDGPGGLDSPLLHAALELPHQTITGVVREPLEPTLELELHVIERSRDLKFGLSASVIEVEPQPVEPRPCGFSRDTVVVDEVSFDQVDVFDFELHTVAGRRRRRGFEARCPFELALGVRGECKLHAVQLDVVDVNDPSQKREEIQPDDGTVDPCDLLVGSRDL